MSNEETTQALEMETSVDIQNQLKTNSTLSEKPEFTIESLDTKIHYIISDEDEKYLEDTFEEILDYLRNNHKKGLSEQDKDVIYLELQNKWNEVSGKEGGKLNEISFNLVLHKQEYKYLTELIGNKMEYNVDTIFYALELKSMMDKMVDNNNFMGDKDAIAFEMTPIDLHYLYHILSKHTVKGLTKSSHNFATVIKRIAASSRVFNYYKEKYDKLSKAIMLWTNSLDDGVNIDQHDPIAIMIWGEDGVKEIVKNQEKVEETEEDESDS